MSTYSESKGFIVLPFLMHFQETDPSPSLITGVYDPKLQMWIPDSNSTDLNNTSTTRSTSTSGGTLTFEGFTDTEPDSDYDSDND